MAFNTQIVLSDGILTLDATKFINPQFPSRATQHPIEDGASISDHIILDNTKLDIEGLVTGAASLAGNAFVSATPKEALQALLRAREKREVVQVLTSLTTFEDMAITSMSFPRDNETGDALDIKISFEQITIASSSFVQVAPVVLASDIADAASGTETLGSQETSVVAAETVTSALSDISASVFGV